MYIFFSGMPTAGDPLSLPYIKSRCVWAKNQRFGVSSAEGNSKTPIQRCLSEREGEFSAQAFPACMRIEVMDYKVQ